MLGGDTEERRLTMPQHHAARRAILLVVTLAGCTGTGGSPPAPDAMRDAPEDTSPAVEAIHPDAPVPLVVAPASSQIEVQAGKPLPTLQLTATQSGTAVVAAWSVDRGELGAVSPSGLFTPSGTVGGQAKVTAALGASKGSASVTILLRMEQNGATQQNGNPGPGGFGGVGGEGLGPAVSPALLAVLDGAATAATVKLLYPYDQTVWPLGVLAPLLQWTAAPSGLGDAVLIQLASPTFQFKGTFGRPAALPAGASLLRHPIPQDVWKQVGYSNAGEDVTITLIFAAGGVAYGPVTALPTRNARRRATSASRRTSSSRTRSSPCRRCFPTG
jgi:hypothetical protein